MGKKMPFKILFWGKDIKALKSFFIRFGFCDIFIFN